MFAFTHERSVASCSEATRILLASELRSYREVLFETLRWLRPRLEIDVVEPNVLDVELERFHPHLVVCSQPCGALRSGVLTWVTLYPSNNNLAEVTTADGRATIVGIRFSDLLAIIEGTELVRRSGWKEFSEACNSAGKAIEKEDL